MVKLLFVGIVADDEVGNVNNLTAETNRGSIRRVLLVILAAGLMFSPTFVARVVYDRLGADISMIAVLALALFLIGTFILLKVVKE